MFHQTLFSVFATLLEDTVGKDYSTVVNQLLDLGPQHELQD